MNQKGFVNITVIIGILILVGVLGYFVVNQRSSLPASTPSPVSGNECTSDSDCPSPKYSCEAIQSVGTAYPNGGPSTFTIIKGVCRLKEGNRCSADSDCVAGFSCHSDVCTKPSGRECAGPNDISCPTDFECIQGCGPPVSRPGDPPPPYFCQLKGYIRNCPICLAENTLIDTPSGAIPVGQLQKGAPVWTIDSFGERISAIVIETAKTPVPPTHKVVHLILDDGREILASPEHPVGDGRNIGDLPVGEFLDGSRIITAEEVPYRKGYTYDILPSGATGFYWAGGILLDSTLH